MTDLADKITPLAEQLPNLQMLILFGSRARGEHRPDSDWDFAVLYEERSAQKDISSLLKIYTLLEQALEIPEDKIDVIDLKECSPILLIMSREMVNFYTNGKRDYSRDLKKNFS